MAETVNTATPGPSLSDEVNANSDLALLKKVLERQRPILKKNRTVDKIGLWDELEQLYRCLEEKEKDFQTAVKVGQMLLEKNKVLSDEKGEMKRFYEMQLQDREGELLLVQSDLKRAKSEVVAQDTLRHELEEAQNHASLMIQNRSESETSRMQLMEEISVLESDLKAVKKNYKEAKDKFMEAAVEIENQKVEIQTIKSREDEANHNIEALLRQIQKLKEEHQEVKPEETTVFVRVRDEMPVISDRSESIKQQLQQQIKEISEENWKLKRDFEYVEEERLELEAAVNKLKEENEELRRAQAEMGEINRSRSNTITELGIELEEKSHQISTSPQKNHRRQNSTLRSISREPSKSEIEIPMAPSEPPSKGSAEKGCFSHFRAYLNIIFCCGGRS
eukprot:TRINITY_DN5203_c0_g1_i1.p1 TRINITY_DN5203_c0_g1~~TRINITY_DN5203_c0_g1_i1.p1  ORF type:complete len:399 (-),score=111.41 TRINITY_DN5203_c0_g1_i1:22-1197(-)